MKRTASPFEIIEILGEGSFGTVCVARVTDDPLRRKVALKILKGAYTSNTKILNRTRDEARLLSRLSHPNIVRVERLIDLGARPVVVMEHVQGPSIDQLLLRFKDGLPGAVALEITRLTCHALTAAYHESLGENGRPMKVIHRDIKPSNILLSIHGEVKVVDFGIAKGEFEGREAETESVVMGSRPYMAPERLDGQNDSPSVDVYSTGMSLFELLTGRTMSLSINPVSHDQAMSRQLAYVQVQGMSAATLDDLRNLIRRMCSYTRDYRPTAAEVAKEIEALLAAIDPKNQITLVEFARTVVVPIYEARPKLSPEEALKSNSDSEFLKEITALSLSPLPGKSSGTPVPNYVPYVFAGALAFALILLVGLVAIKIVMPSLGTAPETSAPTQSGMVKVKIVIPSDAQAQVGDAFVPTKGNALIPPGNTLMQVFFDDGRQLNCDFVAAKDMEVRLIMDAGLWGISIDDGERQACKEVSAPRP